MNKSVSNNHLTVTKKFSLVKNILAFQGYHLFINTVHEITQFTVKTLSESDDVLVYDLHLIRGRICQLRAIDEYISVRF